MLCQKISKRGDTLLEVVFAFAIFSMVCTITIGAMNAGISTAEAALELSQARNEIDAQAETLRFIHDAYVNDDEFQNEDNSAYVLLWKAIASHALGKDDSKKLPTISNKTSCESFYDTTDYTDIDTDRRNIYDAHAFVLNTRKIVTGADENADNYYMNSIISANADDDIFTRTSLYPRVIYTAKGSDDDMDTNLLETETFDVIKKAEGIWIVAIPEEYKENPQYYDFHIDTCWVAPGKRIANTVGTIVRLYNPLAVTAPGGDI